MTKSLESQTVDRIKAGLDLAAAILTSFSSGKFRVQYKNGHDPVTEADRAVNEMLREFLVREGEGWFSEETTDDLSRLNKKRLWVVDPLDGTREFVEGIPEWCVSIALVENGEAIAGGICNPLTHETIVGSRNTGVSYNGDPATVSGRQHLTGALVLASRSEVKRGEWKRFSDAPINVRGVGSVAYKLGLVAAGRADTTWTLVPKHEWDIAAGVALIQAAGGVTRTLEGTPVTFNKKDTLLSGLVACSPDLYEEICSFLNLPMPERAAAI